MAQHGIMLKRLSVRTRSTFELWVNMIRKLWQRIRDKVTQLTGFSAFGFGVQWQLSERTGQRGQCVTDVRVKLIGSSNSTRFFIENVGQAAARNVHFDIESEEGREHPFVCGDYNEKIPIEILRHGDKIEILAALTDDTGVVFKGRWWWYDENDKKYQRNERISLQTL